MITSDDLLSINFYKKESFTGSCKGMRYLIKKDCIHDTAVFCVTIWPGPYNSTVTEDHLKVSAHFPFSEEGKQQTADWLNEQWTTRKNDWLISF